MANLDILQRFYAYVFIGGKSVEAHRLYHLLLIIYYAMGNVD